MYFKTNTQILRCAQDDKAEILCRTSGTLIPGLKAEASTAKKF